jgi:hypothetical protein
MKRQRGRNRGGGNGGKPQQNANRAFDSNGPDNVKVRGNAQHVYEKYQQLARDAQTSGDRVLAENYLQHAEHYFRLLRAMQPQRPASEILGRDQFASGYDIDFEEDVAPPAAAAESEAAQAADGEPSEADGEGRDRGGWQGRDDRPRDDRPRDRDRDRRDRWRDDRARGDRDDRPRGDRDDRPRDDRPRDDRRDERRDDRPRGERQDRDRGERGEREPRPERDPLQVIEPQPTPSAAVEERPSHILRDAEGGESHAPAFLQNRAAAAPESGEAPAAKPRRRRAPRAFDAAADAAPSAEPEEA